MQNECRQNQHQMRKSLDMTIHLPLYVSHKKNTTVMYKYFSDVTHNCIMFTMLTKIKGKDKLQSKYRVKG